MVCLCFILASIVFSTVPAAAGDTAQVIMSCQDGSKSLSKEKPLQFVKERNIPEAKQ